MKTLTLLLAVVPLAACNGNSPTAPRHAPMSDSGFVLIPPPTGITGTCPKGRTDCTGYLTKGDTVTP